MIACELSACPIEPSSPATSPPPKSMKTMIPFAVDESSTEPRHETAITITTPPASSMPGPDDHVGPEVPGQPDDRDRGEVDREHVPDADERRAGEARDEQRRAPDRPHDERLEQPALGVPA